MDGTDWQNVAARVRARANKLSLNLSALERVSKLTENDPTEKGVSRLTWQRLRDGEEPHLTRADKRRVVERTLKWTEGSFAAMLDGRAPIPLPPAGGTLNDEALDAVTARIEDQDERIAMLTQEVTRRLQEFGTQLEDLRERLPRSDRKVGALERPGRPPDR